MSQYSVQSILHYFSKLFLFCKFMGIYPYNFQVFQQYREIKKSIIGTIVVVLVMIVILILYHVFIFSLPDSRHRNMTYYITIFLTYIGPAMMVTDQITAILNQNSLGKLYDRIRIVDENLLHEDCFVDNSSLRKRIDIMIALTFSFEVTVFLLNYIVLNDHSKWSSLLWIFACIPTLYNSLDKIWFAITLYALQKRFLAINNVLNDMVYEHEQYKMNFANNHKNFDIKNKNPIRDVREQSDIVKAGDIVKFQMSKNRIMPVAPAATSLNNFNLLSFKNKNPTKIMYESRMTDVIKLEKKLITLCQIHDEICEIGKMLNELWNYPILLLMAHGFLFFTSQLYFLYCATQDQKIPSLFLSAKNSFITAVFLLYTSGKCIYLIFLSWQTSLVAKRAGVNLHKCAVMADYDEFYGVINHLSLKLFNYTVDVSACGYFSLNMETLYGISGGITSYLSILIQFNLAAQQVKEYLSSLAKKELEEQAATTTSLSTIASSIATTITTTLTSAMTTEM